MKSEVAPAKPTGDQAEPVYRGKQRLEFRWEALAPPTPEMWEAMQDATDHLGMASRGQDATVQELCRYAAELTGHEAALFLPTTTACVTLSFQAFDIAGKQAIMEARCHNYWVEHLHVAATAGAAPVLIEGDKFGAIPPAKIEEAINRSYYSDTVPTGVIALENTHNVCGGTYLTPEYTAEVAELAHGYGVPLFIDGARVFNAAVAQDVPVRELTSKADAVAMSLGKGVAAPMGAVVCGSEDLLDKVELLARRTGTMSIHKAGIFAAAALAGLRTVNDRLAEDHRRARHLGELLSELDGIDIDLETVQTNFVKIGTSPTGLTATEFAHRLSGRGVAVHAIEPWAFKMVPSWITTDEEVEEAYVIIRDLLAELGSDS